MFGSDPRVYTTTVKEFVKDKKGNLCKAVLIKLESKTDEKTGRKMMVPVEGSEYTVNADLVLIAAGFLGSQDYVTKAFGVEVNERTNVKTEAGKYSTNVKDVFTAGDMHRGQSLVVWAIREGREVAREVDHCPCYKCRTGTSSAWICLRRFLPSEHGRFPVSASEKHDRAP